jgi:hypothetical protein
MSGTVGWSKRPPLARRIDAGRRHGGIEAIILGAYVGLVFVMVALRQMDLTTLGLTGQALAKTQQDVIIYWSAPWYLVLLGAVEAILVDRSRQPVGDGSGVHRRNWISAWPLLWLCSLTDATTVFGALSAGLRS